jgi:glycosyltransferase involved in cell wall biosynthesis
MPDIVSETASGNRIGYSNFALNMQRALAQAGVEFTSDTNTILYLGPPHLMPEVTRGKTLVASSMWEVNPMPKDIVAYLNRADVLMAPSQYCASLFRRNGVRKPIHVVPLGIDPDDWPTAPRVRRRGEPLRFLWVNARAERKGWLMLARAWEQASVPPLPMTLTLKTSVDPGESVPPDMYNTRVRVRTIARRLAWEELRDLYCTHHVFLCTSTAEGFGLSPLEAMACGLLVISPRHTGLAEYIHRGVAWVCETDRVGMRYEQAPDVKVTTLAPKVSHLKALIRRAVVEFEATEEMRIKAQAWAKTFTWQRSAEMLVKAMAQVA